MAVPLPPLSLNSAAMGGAETGGTYYQQATVGGGDIVFGNSSKGLDITTLALIAGGGVLIWKLMQKSSKKSRR